MTRCANAVGVGMTALHLLDKATSHSTRLQRAAAKSLVIPQSAGFAITSHLPARWLSGLASSFTSNVSEVQQ